MRYYSRPELEHSLKKYLAEKQAEIRSGDDVERIWTRARRTKRMKKVAQVLASMTGIRERCMYCDDSRATDIDHYKPKREYFDMVFAWLNMLWVCAQCNRLKAIAFPLDDFGEGLILNPTLDDPWRHLVYDSMTNELSARWDAATGLESPKGRATLSVVSSLSHQAVNEGRGRTRRNLVRAVNSFMTSAGDQSDLLALSDAINDNDCYGLVDWFFLRDGVDEVPFRTMKVGRAPAWESVLATLSERAPQ